MKDRTGRGLKVSRRDMIKLSGLGLGGLLFAMFAPKIFSPEADGAQSNTGVRLEHDPYVEVKKVAELPENKELLDKINKVYEDWGILNPFPIEYLMELASEKEFVPDPGKVIVKVKKPSEIPVMEGVLRNLVGVLGNKVSKYIHYVEYDDSYIGGHAHKHGISVSSDNLDTSVHEAIHEIDFCSPGKDSLNIVLKKEYIKAQILVDINLSPNVGVVHDGTFYKIIGTRVVENAQVCLSSNEGNNFDIRSYIRENKDTENRLELIGRYVIEINKSNPHAMAPNLKEVVIRAVRDALPESTAESMRWVLTGGSEEMIGFPRLNLLMTNEKLQNLCAEYISLAREENISINELKKQVMSQSNPIPNYEVEYIS